jgi:acyl carrier protein
MREDTEMATTALTTLTSILAELGIEPGAIRGDASLRKDIGLDSTELVELTLEVRRLAGVALKFEAGEDPTLDEVCALVERADGPAPAASVS